MAVAALLSLLTVVGSLPQDIVFAAATTSANVTGNLDSRSGMGTVSTVSVSVVDASSVPHIVDLMFIRGIGASWDWEASTVDAAITSANPLASGTIDFTVAGAANTVAATPEGVLSLSYTGGATQTVNLQMDTMTSLAAADSLGSNTGGAGGGGGGGGVTGVSTPEPPKVVNIFGRRFSPATIKVTPGTKITWRNGDRVKHTIVGNIFRDKQGGVFDISPTVAGTTPVLPRHPSGLIVDSNAQGKLCARPEPSYVGGPRPPDQLCMRFDFTPALEGTYSYRCTIYRGMAGTILVSSGETQGGTGTGTGGGTGGGGGPPPAPTPVMDRIVTVFGNRFRPDKLQVTVGTTVKWRDGDRAGHTVTGSSYRSSTGLFYDWSPNPPQGSEIPPSTQGGVNPLNLTLTGRPTPVPGSSLRPEAPTQSYQFNNTGAYTYRGELGQMRGTIVVVTPTPVP
jgi:plastocyanin